MLYNSILLDLPLRLDNVVFNCTKYQRNRLDYGSSEILVTYQYGIFISTLIFFQINVHFQINLPLPSPSYSSFCVVAVFV